MKKNMKKIIVVALAVCLLAMTAMAATLAWLVDESVIATNTFVVGANVTIELSEVGATEDGGNLVQKYETVLPGMPLDKEADVTVKANSEDCYVFVEITCDATYVPAVPGDPGTPAVEGFIWAPADGWTHLSGNVYYRTYTKTDTDVVYDVLADDKVTVSSMYPVDEMTAGDDDKTMTIKAYAIQSSYLTPSVDPLVSDAQNAWNLLQDQLAG